MKHGGVLEGITEKIIVLFVAIPIGAMLIDYLLSHSIIGYGYRIFVAPGVIVHETAHAIGCLLTGAKITAFNIFEKSGGHVEHQKSKIPFIGQIVISLAPLLAGGVAIYFLARLVGFREVNLVGAPLSLEGLKSVVLHLISSIDIHNQRNWILLYLLISVAVTMNPSRQDVKNILISLLIIAAGIFAVIKYTSFRPDIMHFLPSQVLMVVGTVDLLLLLVLAFSIIVFAISKLIKPI